MGETDIQLCVQVSGKQGGGIGRYTENLFKYIQEYYKTERSFQVFFLDLSDRLQPVQGWDRQEKKTDDFKKYEEKLIQIISKYGHTLSKLKPGEYVEIAIRFTGIGTKEDFSKGVIKVKKSDIDDFNRGKIDFSNFRKKVDVIYYQSCT